MLNFSSHLQWFQAKIGSYDKQIWETSVEQRILQGLENRPKREGSLNKELIDLDLVRGSTFSKAKPRHGLKSVIINGLKRVIFFPYYFNQWRDHFNKEVVYLFLFHYVIQLIQLILYFMWSNSSEIMLEEILLPIVLALSLGVLHGHIIAPYTVKQRRKKTIVANNKTVSRQQSLQHPLVTQLSDSSQQGPKDNVKSDICQTCKESPLPNRSKKKIVLFKKSSSHNDDLSEHDNVAVADKAAIQTGAYDGETETKDSSWSEQEQMPCHNAEEEIIVDCKSVEGAEPSCTEAVCGSNVVSKGNTKRLKVSDSSERALSCNKSKLNIRRSSQSDVIRVTDKEDLQKFITAKNKHIPDPTPISNVKKDKKSYKVIKTRRQTMDWVDNNSGSGSTGTEMCNCSTVTTTTDVSKSNKMAVTESAINGPGTDSGPTVLLNGNAIVDQEIVASTPSDDQTFSNNSIELVAAKTLPAFDAMQIAAEPKTSHSQPHTPVIHAANKYRHRIEVRKVSSADASPTPSHLGLNTDDKFQLNNTNLQQNSVSCLIEQQCTFHENSISSEDYSVRIVDLNEDTITKSHKKREEFKQMFVKKAQASQVEKGINCNSVTNGISSTSSSRKSVNDTKHVKVKRRHRDECKLAKVETFTKSKRGKESFQSMSETEYDRMNSDVNSTGNSTSDAEDICPNGAEVKIDNVEEDREIVESKKEDSEEHNTTEIGASANVISNNDNNTMLDEDVLPAVSGDVLPPEMTPDDPFVLWYKEAHAPGSLHGMSGSVSCYIWESDELKKTNLSLLDIGWSIIQAVERHEQDKSYSTFGFTIIIVLCFTPVFFRMYINRAYLCTVLHMARHSCITDVFHLTNGSLLQSLISTIKPTTSIASVTSGIGNLSQRHTYSWNTEIVPLILTSVLASDWPVRFIIILGVILRLILYTLTFLMLCVAENSFEQRLQYAKHFCRLTSSRRARKYYLPHFRLNKLANIKCWLSLRSYLKKRGPQRSVDSIISSAFYMLLAMLSLVCVNLLQSSDNLFINRLINWDLTLCSFALGIFMMRFLVLGTKITKKYRNLSVIITEQINLFLAMQTRPHKKEELTLAHNVLRLAESLLKEVEGPFRVCGWSMNPFLYNILKVVILSVFSTVLSETCGFKMKLYKIKINPANW